MYGAIIGDLVGSIYEYEQTKKIKGIKIDDLIKPNAFYSDDTILTIAIIDSIINKKDYGVVLKEYINKYENYHPNFTPYFKNAFSPNLIKWAKSKEIGTSKGNGALMRISPVAYLFKTKKEILRETKLATIPSHNSKEALKYTKLLSLIIYYFKKGYTKEDTFNILNIKVKYIPFQKFNTTCKETFNNCIYALSISNSFEESIKNIILLGGDTDTNAAIVGSMAECLYGIDKELIKKANKYLPKEFILLLQKAYKEEYGTNI